LVGCHSLEVDDNLDHAVLAVPHRELGHRLQCQPEALDVALELLRQVLVRVQLQGGLSAQALDREAFDALNHLVPEQKVLVGSLDFLEGLALGPQLVLYELHLVQSHVRGAQKLHEVRVLLLFVGGLLLLLPEVLQSFGKLGQKLVNQV